MRMMRNGIYKRLGAILSVFLLLTTSCNTSEELLYPHSQRYVVKRQGNIRFIEDIDLHPNSSKQIKVVAGEKGYPHHIVTDELLNKYATMLGLMPRAMTNYILYRFIDDWYGVKYHYGGTDKTGIDCSAFVQRLYEEVFCTELVRTSREQFHSCKMIWDVDNLKEGDLVFFKTRGRRISHVGIYLANNFFVHASSSGVMISNLTESYWSKRYAGAGKIPKGTNKQQML